MKLMSVNMLLTLLAAGRTKVPARRRTQNGS